MNKKQPAQLRQRTDYLRQKIEYLYEQVKYGGAFELKMKFVEFVDTSIERINNIEDKKQYSSESVAKSYEEHSKAEQNQSEEKRLERQKRELQQKQKELDHREKQLEIDFLRIQLQSSKVLKDKAAREASDKQDELRDRIADLEKKIRDQEREIERIAKMNMLQTKEIQSLKDERNRAEKRELQWKDKYQTEFGGHQSPKQRKAKVPQRSQQGIRVLRTFTNNTSEKKGSERFIFRELPLKFHIVKIVYGIKVGMLKGGQQVEYFDELSLYEKEEMEMFEEGGELTLLYVKRRVRQKLKYKLQRGQVFLMLFGKGDSVAIDQTQ